MSDLPDLNVRGVDTEYEPVISQQVGREVNGETVLLRSITVTVAHKRRRNGETYTDYFEVSFRPDHEREVVEPSQITDAHDDLGSLPFAKLWPVTRTAENAVVSYLEEIGLDYEVGFVDIAFGNESKGEPVDVYSRQDHV